MYSVIGLAYGQGEFLMTGAREFVDFWIENSVHAKEQSGQRGGSQDAEELARRCFEMAKSQGILEDAIRNELGDLTNYIRGKLRDANNAERDRRQH
jgi:hypothetical protein